MHTTAIGTNNVPAFLIKLWKLVEDSKCDDLICWNSTGTTFLIRDQAKFSKELLPLYFKHNNMASFIRQLNMYGFRKVVNVEQGGLRMEKDEIEFQHMYFLKGHEYLLELIKRKASINKAPEEVKLQPELVSKMIFDVKNLHGKQENLDTKLSTMKRENEALWREIAALRQQHMKQQQIVNKLIQFLLSLVQPNRGLGVKRKLPLMLNDSSHLESKLPRVTRTFSLDGEKGSEIQITTPSGGVFSGVKSLGPVIHDITDVVDAEAFLKSGVQVLPSSVASPSVAEVHPVVDSPIASTSMDCVTPAELSPSTQLEPMVPARMTTNLETVSSGEPSSPTNSKKLDEFFREISTGSNDCLQPTLAENSNAEPMLDILVPANDNDSMLSKLDFVDHIDNMQVELEALKDILSNSGCTIDTSTLMGLFCSDDVLSSKGLADVGEIGKLSGNEIVGTELTQYNPSIFDFQDGESATGSSDLIPGPNTDLQDDLFEYVEAVLDRNDAENAELLTTPEETTDIGETVPTTDLALTADLELLVDAPTLLAEEATLSPQKSVGGRKDVL